MKNALLGSLMLAAALVGCRGGESEKPPVHLIPNMDTQEKGRAYRRDSSGLFADGRTMRDPVPGTVALGHLDEDDVLVEGLDDKGQPTDKFPAAIDLKSEGVTARGQARFEIYCTPCHGSAGDGKGLVATVPAPGTGLVVPPANLLDQRVKDLVHGKLYSAIKNGVNNGNMPSHAAQIPVEDRWAIVAYVRKLQGVGDVVVATMEKPKEATLEYGAFLYKTKTCNACHSLDGVRIVGPTFKGLFGKTESCASGDVVVDEAYLKESILQPNAKLVTGFPPAMPPLPLDPLEVESLILFIKAQK